MKETETGSGGITQAAATLFPGYFALVMATCIVSIAAYLLGMRALAWALLVLYGPPPRPLASIELEVREGGEVWAIGRKAGSDEHSA